MKAKEISEILSKCGLPMPDRERLLQIASIEGKEFENKLLEANRGSQEAKQYLTNVIKAVAPFCRQTLQRHGIDAPLERIFAVAKNEGSIFFKALNASLTEDDNASMAVEYLRSLFAEEPVRQDQADMGNGQPEAGNGQDPDELPSFDSFKLPGDAAPPGSAASNQNAHQEASRDSTQSMQQQSMEEWGIPAIVPPREKVKSEPKATQPGRALESAATSNQAPFYSFHVYGAKAALCFSEDQTRSGNIPTMRVEAAPARGAGGHFDWARKVSIQLTQQELYQMLATLEDELQGMQIIHGDKRLEIVNQSDKFYLRMAQTGRPVLGIPVVGAYATQIRNLIRKQIRAADPHLTSEDIQRELQLIGRMASNAAAVPAR